MAFLKLALAYCRSTAKNIYFFRVELYIRYFFKYCLFYILYAMYIYKEKCVKLNHIHIRGLDASATYLTLKALKPEARGWDGY